MRTVHRAFIDMAVQVLHEKNDTIAQALVEIWNAEFAPAWVGRKDGTTPSVLSCLGRGLLTDFQALLAYSAIAVNLACASCVWRFRLAWSTTLSTASFRATSLAAVLGMSIFQGASV
jgi:hypothetical protein